MAEGMSFVVEKRVNGRTHKIEVKMGNVSKDGEVKFKYRIDSEEKWFRGRLYSDGILYFYGTKRIGNREVAGVRIDDDEVRRRVDEYCKKVMEEYEREKEKIINEIVEGKRLIDYSIVGCDYPHYQAWVEVPENMDAQLIMKKAIDKIYRKQGISIYPGNPCDFLDRKGGVPHLPAFREEIPSFCVNLKYDEERQKYHGFKSEIVTGFSAKLEDLVRDDIARRKEKKAKIDEIFRKARETGEPQVLREYSVECNDPDEECDIDNVTEYAMPDGSVKIVRHHTW